MAKAKLSSYLKELHGRAGNYIHYNVNGRQYVRSHAIPRNPRTQLQQENRAAFAVAVKLWQELSPEEKMIYNRKALRKPYSGYNLFISMQMKGESTEGLNHSNAVKSKDRLFPPACMNRIGSVSIPYMDLYTCTCSVEYGILLKIPREDALFAA